MKKENIITEKFALLNLIRALGGLSAEQNRQDGRQGEQFEAAEEAPKQAAPRAQGEEKKGAAPRADYNFMASVIARHEETANRIKSKNR